MRMTRLHAPTLKEVPKDTEIPSHQLLLRGGFIRRVAAGIYNFLPLGKRVLHKVETIIREELDAAGAQEIAMPLIQPAELWQESGRWEQYGPELMRMNDRKKADFCLGPTHEEVVVDLVRRDVRSWRSLPLNIYQIQNKFRDEIRPRAGLLRCREFLMKDAYSFDIDEDAALATYDSMYDAYSRIFSRCGFDFRAVEADSGAIGGSRSHEFQVLAETGEDAMVSCTRCDYAANVEKAELSAPPLLSPAGDEAEPQEVQTPGKRTIAEVSAYLKTSSRRFIKTLLVELDDEVHAVLIRGDHELNELKLKNFVGAQRLDFAKEADVVRITGAPVGFAGPVNLTGVASIIADHSIEGMSDAVCGANAPDMHMTGVVEGRDFTVSKYGDLRMAQDGDLCPRCASVLKSYRGIEIGHVFFLGTKYSGPMRCNYLDETGREQPMVMGCYGIGVSRIIAAAIEQHHDEHGIVWPMALAPYQVIILPLQMNKPEVVAHAEALYDSLRNNGFEVLLDDRNERAGSKFKDAELMGIPVRIALGSRGLSQGVLELKIRRGGEVEEIAIDAVLGRVQELVT